MALTFQTERFPDIWDEVQPLLQQHWDEVGVKDITGPPDANEELYRRMDAEGILHITTARHKGRLAGYAAYLVYAAHHYRSRMLADADVFFLAPGFRRGMAGVRLLKAAEAALLERGVTTIVQKVKVSHDCGALFKRMGYRHTENIWMKAV